MNLFDYFPCLHMEESSLMYQTCLKRQAKHDGYQNPEYTLCYNCPEGKQIKSLFNEAEVKQAFIKIRSTRKRSKVGTSPWTYHYQGVR